MSTEVTRENATFETLKAIPYGNLLETFTALGIKEVWQPGTKGVSMIQEALEKLAIIKSLENDGKTEEQIQEKFDKQEAAQEAQEEEAELNKAKREENEERASMEVIKKMDLSEEVILQNLKNIEKNLMNGIPAQRKILLNKKTTLLKMLSHIVDDSEES